MDGPAGLTFALDADRRAGLDSRFQLLVALSGPGERHRNPGELGAFQQLQLAPRNDAKAFDVPSNKVQQLDIRVCAY